MELNSINSRNNYNYSLQGVIQHSGSGLTGGHFRACIKTVKQSWHTFDDATVSEENNSDVIDDRSPGWNNYIMFYQKEEVE
jgi:ubiquitin C-terminal hydrolase